jgi:hypothetical protein
MLKCSQSGKFVEAEVFKQRLFQLKKIENDRVKVELKDKYNHMKENLELEQKLELDQLNEEFDEHLSELEKRYKEIEQNLNRDNEERLYNLKEEFQREDFCKMMPNTELLNLNKIMENAIKLKK